MDYLKGVLATVAALFLAVLIPTIWWSSRGFSTEKATGLTAVVGGLLESILSPWFWILTALFLVLFYVAGPLEHKTLRIALFWIPTIAVSAGGFGLWALFVLLARRFGKG